MLTATAVQAGSGGTPPPPQSLRGVCASPADTAPRCRSRRSPRFPAFPRLCAARPRGRRFGVPGALVTHQRPCPSRIPRCWFYRYYLMHFAVYLSGGQLGCLLRWSEAKGAVLSLVPVLRRRWNSPPSPARCEVTAGESSNPARLQPSSSLSLLLSRCLALEESEV